MKSFALASIALISTAMASAGTFDFTPNPSDLNDLDHYYAYSWGVDFTLPKDEVIVGAQIKIKNIWDWTVEDGDILHVDLLNSAPSGVKEFYDDQAVGDYFAGQGKKIGTWTDPVGGVARNVNLTFDLGQAGLLADLNRAAKSGRMAFGFDPDCHYFNDGVSLHIQTAPVPEPTSMAALAIGGIGLIRRRRAKKA